MSSPGEIAAKAPCVEDPSEKEECALTLHIGVFFDGSETSHAYSSLWASNYSPPTEDTHRRLTLIVNDCEVPSYDELVYDGMEQYGLRLGDLMYYVFSRLHNLLSGYLQFASNLTVEIDTFATEEGFFAASIFCEAIESGCFDELPPYGEYALTDINGAGIIADLKMRGAKIELKSFTTFQIQNNTSQTYEVASTENKPTRKSKIGINKKNANIPDSETAGQSDLSERFHADDVMPYDEEYINAEYITFNNEQSLFKLRVTKTEYPGSFSKLSTAVDWMENTALLCDIVGLTAGVTGIGLVVTVPCEFISCGLSGLSAIACFGLSSMAKIDGDEALAKEYQIRATFDAVGSIPVTGIIAKVGKGAKFATKKTTVGLVEKSINSAPTNVTKLPTRGKPALKGLETNPHPDVSSASAIQKSAEAAERRAQFSVLEGGMPQGRYLKVANGSTIFEPYFTSRPAGMVFDSIENFGFNNHLFIGSSNYYFGAKATGRNVANYQRAASSSSNEKVEPIENIHAIDNDYTKFSGDSQRYNVIGNIIKLGEIYLAGLRLRYLKITGKIADKSYFSTIKKLSETYFGKSFKNEDVRILIQIWLRQK